MSKKLIISGNIEPDKLLDAMLKTLHFFGRDIAHPTIESVTKILRDEYNVEVVTQKQPPTIQEFALSKMDELAKQITILSADLKRVQQKTCKDLTRNQNMHFNQMQNVRIKAFKARHR